MSRLDATLQPAPDSSGMPRRLALLVSAGAVSAFGVISAYSLRFDTAVNSGDFLAIFMPRVHLLHDAPWDLERWVSPAYPVGYNFLILWLGKFFGFILAAKLLSLVAAVLMFAAVFGIAREMFDEPIAAAAVVLLAVDRQMYRFAHWEGPDMPAVCLQLFAIWMVIRAARGSRAAAIAGGACLGAAFLMRYQTALVILTSAAFLVVALRARPRVAARQVVLVLAASGMVAAPQFIANLAVQGRLFPEFPMVGARRAMAFANGDFRTWWFANGSVFESAAAASMPTRGELARFAFRQMASDLFVLQLLPPFIGSLAWGGLLLALCHRAHRRSAVVFVGAIMIVWIVGMSWYVFHVRGMLLFAPLLTMFAAFLAWTAVREAHEHPAWRAAAPAVVVGAIALTTAWLTVRPQFWPANYDRTAVEVTSALKAAGMTTTTEVAGLTYGMLENSTSPDADFYPIVGWDLANAKAGTWADLQRFLCGRRYQFLVADGGADEYLFPSIGLFDKARTPPGLQELYRASAPQRAVAFKVLPSACALPGGTP